MEGLPFNQFPSGWFQIGWSHEFPTGISKPLRFFGRELVAWRGASGTMNLLDAHCPHMGAHLGYGGKIIDDSIECPFHGWIWDADGNNTSIPDGSPPNRAQRIPCWSVRENSGCVLAWFHPEHLPPTWETGPIVEDVDSYYSVFPRAARLWELALHPQVVAENSIDGAHFALVHRAGAPGKTVRLEDRGPHLIVTTLLTYGSDKKSTWLTPEGPVEGYLEIDLWGVGISCTHFRNADDAVSVTNVTPIDEEKSALFMTNYVPKEPGADEILSDAARRRIDEQFKQAQRDFPIWEHMRFVERPPLSRSEVRQFNVFRKWSDRFYGSEPVTADVEPALVDFE